MVDYHGLGLLDRYRLDFWMRPQLNSGTLGRLEPPMWVRLDHPSITDVVRGALPQDDAHALADVLAQAASRPWAGQVSAVTSMSRLFLTTRETFWDDTPSGFVYLSLRADGQVAFDYVPPHSNESDSRVAASPARSLPLLETLVLRLLRDRGMPGPEAQSTDKDPDCPRFALGSKVRVVVNARNYTPHDAVVARHVWHHKFACWTYFLEENGKGITKRYLAEDLESS